MGGVPDDIDELCEASIASLKNKMQSVVLPLGVISSGVCRHRAMLVKLVCDELNIKCTLTRGVFSEVLSDSASS